jgi:hypothetical protein
MQALIPQTTEWRWADEEKPSFEAAKRVMSNAGQLFYSKWDRPFFVYTVASFLGVATGLYQKQET